MSWGQYLEYSQSFVDPRTGLLSGPWAECIAWGVVFEHANDWSKDPRYARDGPVGGILEALGQKVGGNQQLMEAAQRLEDQCHQLAESGQPLPAIQQAVQVPQGAVPGQPMKVANPQMPGTYQTITCPQGAQAGQQVMAPAPMQPTQNGKTGMSTGSKVAFAAGGVVAVGAAAGVAYYATQGGGFDGFVGDMGAAGDWAGGAAGDAAGWVDGGGIGDAAGQAGDFAQDFGGDAMEWGGDAAEDVGGFVMDLF
jgi:hypothetical protein